MSPEEFRADFEDALRAVEEERRAAEDVGPCPNCGAPADVDMISPGEVRCSRACWRDDPAAYVAAARTRRRPVPPPPGPRLPNPGNQDESGKPPSIAAWQRPKRSKRGTP